MPPRRHPLRWFLPVAAAMLVAAASVPAGPVPAAAAPTASGDCPSFGASTQTGTIADPAVVEASGLVASRRNPGVFWTHNDNHGENRVFAVDGSGRSLGSVRLDGADPLNPEDLAIGPGRDSDDALYLADIGDNDATRASARVYRFDEPSVETLRGGEVVLNRADYETFPLRYEKPSDPGTTWSRNAEAMAIDPVTERLYVFEKEYNWIGGPRVAWVYSVDVHGLSESATNRLRPVVAVTSNIFTPDTAGFTGADVSADGRLVVAKNRLDVFTWVREPGETVEDALARAPKSVCPGTSGVGEAVAVLPDSSAYAMVREGAASPVWSVPVTVPPSDWTCGGLVPSLLGTPDDDIVIGTPGRDVIAVRTGNDIVDGAGGDDVICGAAGTDLLLGGPGADIVHGNRDDDFVSGGAGVDHLFGEEGVDGFEWVDGPDFVVDAQG